MNSDNPDVTTGLQTAIRLLGSGGMTQEEFFALTACLRAAAFLWSQQPK